MGLNEIQVFHRFFKEVQYDCFPLRVDPKKKTLCALFRKLNAGQLVFSKDKEYYFLEQSDLDSIEQYFQTTYGVNIKTDDLKTLENRTRIEWSKLASTEKIGAGLKARSKRVAARLWTRGTQTPGFVHSLSQRDVNVLFECSGQPTVDAIWWVENWQNFEFFEHHQFHLLNHDARAMAQTQTLLILLRGDDHYDTGLSTEMLLKHAQTRPVYFWFDIDPSGLYMADDLLNKLPDGKLVWPKEIHTLWTQKGSQQDLFYTQYLPQRGTHLSPDIQHKMQDLEQAQNAISQEYFLSVSSINDDILNSDPTSLMEEQSGKK